MGGKGESVLRKNFKGHMDKTKGEWNQEMYVAGVGGKIQTTVLEQQ